MAAERHRQRISAYELDNLTDIDWRDLFEAFDTVVDDRLGPLRPYLCCFYEGSRGVAPQNQLDQVLRREGRYPNLQFGQLHADQLKRHLRDLGFAHIKVRHVEMDRFGAYRLGKLPLRYRKHRHV